MKKCVKFSFPAGLVTLGSRNALNPGVAGAAAVNELYPDSVACRRRNSNG